MFTYIVCVILPRPRLRFPYRFYRRRRADVDSRTARVGYGEQQIYSLFVAVRLPLGLLERGHQATGGCQNWHPKQWVLHRLGGRPNGCGCWRPCLGGWHPEAPRKLKWWARRRGPLVGTAIVLCLEVSPCMKIHAGTLGSLLRGSRVLCWV